MAHSTLLLAALLANLAHDPADAAGRDRSAYVAFAAAKTGKERLGDKATDEQRVNDCNVPAAQRTRARPAKCPGEKGS